MSIEEGATRFETFDPDRHDRGSLSTGVEPVDNYFRKTTNKLSKVDNVRVTVLVRSDQRLIGFHAINVHSVDYRDLPARYARTRPAHGNIPVAYIAMIGVGKEFQGCGFSGDLLFDCLVRITDASELLGISVVMLDVLDCGDERTTTRRKALYEHYGFKPLPDHPMRLFLPIAEARELVKQS